MFETLNRRHNVHFLVVHGLFACIVGFTAALNLLQHFVDVGLRRNVELLIVVAFVLPCNARAADEELLKTPSLMTFSPRTPTASTAVAEFSLHVVQLNMSLIGAPFAQLLQVPVLRLSVEPSSCPTTP